MFKRQLQQLLSLSRGDEDRAEDLTQGPLAKMAKIGGDLAKTAAGLIKTAKDLTKTAEMAKITEGAKAAEDLAKIADDLAKETKDLVKVTYAKVVEVRAQEAEDLAQTAKEPAEVAKFRACAVWYRAEVDRLHQRTSILILQGEERRITAWEKIQEEKKEGKYPTFCSDSICTDESFAVLKIVLMFLETEAKAAEDRQALAYVINREMDTVSVIATASHAVIATIPVGEGSSVVAIARNGTKAYVVNGDNAICIIDTASHTIVDTIEVEQYILGLATTEVGQYILGLAITPDSTRAYALISDKDGDDWSDTIFVIDMVCSVVIAVINMGKGVSGVAITPDGTKVYAVSGKNVTVIATDSNQVIATIEVKQYLWEVAITPDGTKVYAVGRENVTVIATDSNQVIATIETERNLKAVAITPDGTKVYAVGRKNVTVIATDSNQVIATIEIEGNLWEVAITPDSKQVYVANDFGGIFVIDTARHRVIATISALKMWEIPDGLMEMQKIADGLTGEMPSIVAISRRPTW
jgi:YVTN family beta-propeller protein